MKPLLIAVLFFYFTNCQYQQGVSNNAKVAGPQALLDSGFTNRAEAKNVVVNYRKEGKWIEYIDDVDEPATRISDTNTPCYKLTCYNNGEPYGLVHGYYKSGAVYFRIFYKNGEKNGIFKEYYENGKLKEITPYTNGKINGLSISYWNNGNKFTEDSSINGVANGMSRLYYDNGKVENETYFVNGKTNVNGVDRHYGYKGNLFWELDKTKGSGSFVWKEYYENGKLVKEQTHTIGLKDSSTCYDINGNKIKCSEQ
jgi:antitoxin component YwqK of YwqJK toxin-antitoxin module